MKNMGCAMLMEKETGVFLSHKKRLPLKMLEK